MHPAGLLGDGLHPVGHVQQAVFLEIRRGGRSSLLEGRRLPILREHVWVIPPVAEDFGCAVSEGEHFIAIADVEDRV